MRIALLAMAVVLTGCPDVDLGENPPDPPTCRPSESYFVDTIWPQMLDPADTSRSCVGAAGCHRTTDGRGPLRLDVSDPASNYQVVTRFLNCGSPLDSALWTKPVSGVDPHGGGDLFDASLLQDVFLQWFNQL